MSDRSLSEWRALPGQQWSSPPSLPLRVLRVGCHLIPAQYQQHPGSTHHFWSVYIFDPGLRLSWGRQHLLTNDRTCVLLPPYLRFSHPWGPGAGHGYIHFEISGQAPATVAQVLAEPLLIDDRALHAALSEMLLQSTDPHSDAWRLGHEAQGCCHRALGWLIARLTPERRQWLVKPREAWGRLQPALDYINEHLAQSIGLADLALVLGVGAPQVARLFRRHLGCSPIQHILQRRVQRAARLLSESDDDMETIAQACGFPNRHYLSRVFRAHMHQSPVAYRRTHAGGG